MYKLILLYIFLAGCSTAISGRVTLYDSLNKELSYKQDDRTTTINIIRIDAPNVQKGSYTIKSDAQGFFNTSKHNIQIEDGIYKIEAYKNGFTVDTVTTNITSSKEYNFNLRKIKDLDVSVYTPDSKETTIESSGSVSIQPPQI